MADRPKSLLPPWMMEKPAASSGVPGLQAGESSRKMSDFAARTIHSILSFSLKEWFQEKSARQPGLLQRLDPRVKLLSTLALLLAASLVRAALPLLLLLVWLLMLAACSRIQLGLLLRRIWFWIFLFGFLGALPALLNWVTPGQPLVELHHWDHEIPVVNLPATLSITDSGLRASALLFLRLSVSVILGSLLVLATPWQQLLSSLRVLGVPQAFVFLLAMTHRYLHLMLGLMLDMHWAKKSRTLARLSKRQEQAWTASRMSYLFQRSYSLSENVHQAMLARGFQGEVKLLEQWRLEGRDWMAVVVVLLLCFGLVGLSARSLF